MQCPVCGTEGGACGEPSVSQPVDLLSEGSPQMGTNSIKVDMNGDGKDIRNVAPGDLDRFLAANPGAARVGEAPAQASAPEVEVTEDAGGDADEGATGPQPRAGRARKE